MQLDENTLDMQLGQSDLGLSALRLWEHTELGQVNVFSQAISAQPELNDAATFIDIVHPRRPPKVPHLWPPKLLHPAGGDLMH